MLNWLRQLDVAYILFVGFFGAIFSAIGSILVFGALATVDKIGRDMGYWETLL